MRLLLITAILLYISATQAFTPKKHVTCSRRWVKVGCYRDSLSPRPLPFELLNDRDVTSKNNDGYLLDWYKWGESIHSLACRCAEKARAKGYRMFGLQFYGECWSGPMSQMKFNKDGPSDNCYQQLTKPYGCVKSDPLSECVGGEATNYIYMLTENTPEPQSPDIDGGYTKWSEWSVCSKTCGEGTTSRERTCNNPTPKGNGKPCNPRHGYPVQTEKCHLADCPPKCKKALDVGIVVDSSASVRRENFAKVKMFLEELVKKLEVGAALTHVGMIRYSHYANTLWDFNGDVNHNLQKLLAAIENIKFKPGGTRTDLALEKANTELFSSKGGQRSSVPHVLLVVTDGKTASNSKAYAQVLKPLQDKGIKLVSIGVGHSIGMAELKIIALQHDQNVFKLDSFDDLVKRLSNIMHSFCMTKF